MFSLQEDELTPAGGVQATCQVACRSELSKFCQQPQEGGIGGWGGPPNRGGGEGSVGSIAAVGEELGFKPGAKCWNLGSCPGETVDTGGWGGLKGWPRLTGPAGTGFPSVLLGPTVSPPAWPLLGAGTEDPPGLLLPHCLWILVPFQNLTLQGPGPFVQTAKPFSL